MKSFRDIAEEIVEFTSSTALYPPYQVEEVEKILRRYFNE